MKGVNYINEIEWGIGEIRRAFSDRNPNREAQINLVLYWLNEVLIARRSHERPPERPDVRGRV